MVIRTKRGPWMFSLDISAPMEGFADKGLSHEDYEARGVYPTFDGRVSLGLHAQRWFIVMSPDEADRVADLLKEYAATARKVNGQRAPWLDQVATETERP